MLAANLASVVFVLGLVTVMLALFFAHGRRFAVLLLVGAGMVIVGMLVVFVAATGSVDRQQ